MGYRVDKFLRDTELPVLDDTGRVSHEQALEWAKTQYDAFAERRCTKAETKAEKRYLDDLRRSAETVEAERMTSKKKPHAMARRRKETKKTNAKS